MTGDHRTCSNDAVTKLTGPLLRSSIQDSVGRLSPQAISRLPLKAMERKEHYLEPDHYEQTS